MPFGEETLWDKTRVVTSAHLEELIRGAYELEDRPNRDQGPARTFLFSGGKGSIGFISPMSSHICQDSTDSGSPRMAQLSLVSSRTKSMI